MMVDSVSEEAYIHHPLGTKRGMLLQKQWGIYTGKVFYAFYASIVRPHCKKNFQAKQ
jgi:hypothetical protein